MHLETILTKVLGRLVGWPSHRLLVLPEVAPQHQLPSCSDQAAMALVPTRRCSSDPSSGNAGPSSSNTGFAFGLSKSSSSAHPFLGNAPGIAIAGVSAPSPATSFGSLPPLGTNGGNTSSSGAFQFGTGGAGGSAPFTLGATSGTPGPAMGAISGGGAGFSMGQASKVKVVVEKSGPSLKKQ